MSFENQPKVILFCGLPGSGKTTLGRKLEKELPAVRLCPDEWMADLGIDLFNEEVRTKLEISLWKLGRQLLKLGQHVILENGLWSRAERDEKLQEARELDVHVEMHYFAIPLKELLRRIEIRNRIGGHGTVPVTREQMKQYWSLFQRPNKAELALYDTVVIHKPERAR